VCRILVIAGLLGGAVPVMAQAQFGSTFADSLVVTASLGGEEEEELTASVEVIEAEEIEERQATTVADLLATVPGLTLARSGSPGKVTSLFTRGTESDHTLVLWNGIELNNPYFGGFDWAFLPTEGVRRIEVARGPFSAVHGADALGGVVQVLTRSAPGGSVRLEGGADGYSRASLSAGAEAGRTRILVAGHLRRGDGQVENDFYDGEELVTRADWSLRPGVSIGVAVRAADADNGIPFAGGRSSPQRNLSWQERQIAVPFRADFRQWSVDAQLSRVTLDSAFRDPDDAFGFTSSDTRSEARRLRSAATRRFREESWVAFGGEVEEVEVSDRSVFGANLQGASQTTRSVFSQVSHRQGRVRLDAGLRFDDNDAFGSRTTPRLGLLWNLGSKTSLRASYGEGFRAPSLGELFFPFSGNAELEPEVSESLEIGWERESGSWRLGLVGFENRLRNLIDFDFVTFSNQNIGRARSRGVEIWAEVDHRMLDISWNATFLEAEDRLTGLPLLRRPEKSSNVVATTRPGRWTVSLTGRFVGERDDIDPVSLERIENDSFLRLDLAVQWRADRSLTPFARIENLADREYSEVVGFPAPGRTWVGGLAFSWR
jgi:vitamin B12 transporter